MVKLLTKYHKVGIRLKITCKATKDQPEKPLWRTFLRSIPGTNYCQTYGHLSAKKPPCFLLLTCLALINVLIEH